MSNTNRDIEDCRSTLERYYEKGLNDGRNEVWELARKIFTFNNNKMEEIFGVAGKRSAFDDLSPQVALAKLEIYEKEQNEIKVGDVVKNGNGETEFVVIATSEETINGQPILRPIGKTLIKGVIFASDTDLKKTGRHIDIQSILQQIGGKYGENQ